MTSVKVKFCPSSNPDSPGKIIYLIKHENHSRQISTGFKLFPYEWNKELAKPFISCDMERAEFLNQICEKLENDLRSFERIIGHLESIKGNYTTDDVVRGFRRFQGEPTFFSFMDGILLKLRNVRQSATASNYLAALRSFSRFRAGVDLTIRSMNSFIMEDYQNYLKSEGLSRNSISFYMRIIRAVYNRAVYQGITLDKHPFRTVFTGYEKTRKRAISLAEIKRIREIDLKAYPKLDFARDVFIFMFFCRGMSFIDMAYLKRSNIENGILSYKRRKTGQQLQIKIVKQLDELIIKYYNRDSPFLLPIIKSPGQNEYRQYNVALRKVNTSLRKIGMMIGLPIRLTTYVCRHSWATIAKRKNIPLAVISEALGHDSLLTTQIYLDSIGTSAIDRANEIVIKGL